MPSFRVLPRSVHSSVGDRPLYPGAQQIHVPVARVMVDCGVYVDGQRVPGKYSPAAAVAKVGELGEGLHPLAVEDVVQALTVHDVSAWHSGAR